MEEKNHSRTSQPDSSKTPSLLKQALQVNRKPFPWIKAFSAGLAAALPVLIGLLFGNLEYGLLAGMGGFTYLYVFNIPYAQRAKKLILVIIGLTIVTALGTLAAPYPIAIAVLMAIIGATSIFVFGALKITGPSAIFFVLVFSLTTGMPVEPEAALLRAGLVFLGGCLSFLIAMVGYLFDPHGPETEVVQRVYKELGTFVDSVGTETFNEARHIVITAINEADEILVAGYIPWRETNIFKRLYVLNNHAHTICMYIIENFSDDHAKLPSELAQSIRNLGTSLDQKNRKVNTGTPIFQPDGMEDKVAILFEKVYDADAIRNEPNAKINQAIQISKPSLPTVIGGAFDKNSIVFITALRFGFITFIAAFIAYQFEFARTYWVPLSCVAVLSGFSIVATFHRAIQRGFGTVFGILIASVILAAQPSGYIIALFILLLTFMTELFIVKNYGLAALFFTPNALLMAESTSTEAFSFTYFASARIIDVLIGSLIGLVGVWLMGRRSASSRVPHLIAKTLRSQAQFLVTLFSDQGKGFNPLDSREIKKMRTNISNLKTMYQTALGEVPVNRGALEYYWPIIFTIDQLGYLLENCSKRNTRKFLNEEPLAQLLYVFETMANAVNRKRSPSLKKVPFIDEFPSVRKEIIHLQKSLVGPRVIQ